MRGFNSLVLQEQRHLKWRALDPLEQVLMILCGVAITGFSRAGAVRHHHAHDRASLAVAAGSDDDLLHLRHLHRRRRRHAPQRPPLSRRARGIADRQQAAVLRDVQPAGRARRRALHDLFRLPQLSRRLQEPAHAVDDAAVEPLCGHSAVRRPGLRCSRSSRWSTAGSTASPAARTTRRGSRCDHQRQSHLPDGFPVPVPRLYGRAGGVRADRLRAGR